MRVTRISIVLLLGFLLIASACCPPPNQAPEIISLTTYPASVSRGGNFTITCVASDPEDGPLTYTWSALGGGTFSGTGSEVTWTAPDWEGTYTIRVIVIVTDDKGATDTKSCYVVVDNQPPVITSLIPVPASVSPGGSSTVTCVASDPEDGPLTYTWSAPGGGNTSGTGSEFTWTAPDAEGTYTIRVTVTDDKEATATKSCQVAVGNQPPVITSLTPIPASVSPGGSSTVTCVASDPDGDTLTYTWTATGGNLSGTGSILTWEAPGVEGTFTISVTVDDGINLEVHRYIEVVAEFPSEG